MCMYKFKCNNDVILWGNDIGKQSNHISYLEIRLYVGKRLLSFWSLTSADEISNIEHVIKLTTSSDKDKESLESVTISGVKLYYSYTLVSNCSAN